MNDDMLNQIEEQQNRVQSMIMMLRHHGTAPAAHETFCGAIVYVFDPRHGQSYEQRERPHGLSLMDILAKIEMRINHVSDDGILTALVLRGGHGVEGLRGSKAGEHFWTKSCGAVYCKDDEIMQYPILLTMSLKRSICQLDHINGGLTDVP